MNTRTMRMNSRRNQNMFAALFWIGLYISLILIGGHAGPGWAIVATLIALYGAGVVLRKKVENSRGRCVRKDHDDT